LMGGVHLSCLLSRKDLLVDSILINVSVVTFHLVA
jgi:hypothetical protein